jgi:hypothetical protein
MGPPTKKQVLEREAVRDPKMQKISSMFPVIPKPTPAATIGRPKKVQRSGRPPSKSKETTNISKNSELQKDLLL